MRICRCRFVDDRIQLPPRPRSTKVVGAIADVDAAERWLPTPVAVAIVVKADGAAMGANDRSASRRCRGRFELGVDRSPPLNDWRRRRARRCRVIVVEGQQLPWLADDRHASRRRQADGAGLPKPEVSPSCSTRTPLNGLAPPARRRSVAIAAAPGGRPVPTSAEPAVAVQIGEGRRDSRRTRKSIVRADARVKRSPLLWKTSRPPLN